MTFRRLRTIRAPTTKSELVSIGSDRFADVLVRLGHIGDQVFGLAVTDLIQRLYPYLRVGPTSVRRLAVVRIKSFNLIVTIQKVRDCVKCKTVLAEMYWQPCHQKRCN